MKLLLIASLSILSTAYSSANTLGGKVTVDGSSTVFPITEAVAEEFGKIHPKVKVTVGVSGTGGGFKKFGAGEIDISDASRPIKEAEKTHAKGNNIEYIELPVAYDGLSVVVNLKNTWVDHLTVDELKKIWEPGSKVKTWKDVRASWPAENIKLYGPGTDSGTFDYFTETINGKAQASRSDFTKSEDDNVLVQGVAGDKNSLGYFGYAYYVENKKRLKVVPIRGKGAAITPDHETIRKGTYEPLSRPVYIYVSKKAMERPEVKEFVKFYVENAGKLSEEVGYVSLPTEKYAQLKKLLPK